MQEFAAYAFYAGLVLLGVILNELWRAFRSAAPDAVPRLAEAHIDLAQAEVEHADDGFVYENGDNEANLSLEGVDPEDERTPTTPPHGVTATYDEIDRLVPPIAGDVDPDAITPPNALRVRVASLDGVDEVPVTPMFADELLCEPVKQVGPHLKPPPDPLHSQPHIGSSADVPEPARLVVFHGGKKK